MKPEGEQSPSPNATPPAADTAPKTTDEPASVGQAASLPGADIGPQKVGPPPAASSPPGSSPAKPQPPPPAVPPAAEEPRKHAIPSTEVQRAVGSTIEETYKISEAKTPEAKLTLAKELSEAAGKSTKAEEQYVLLRKAVDLACDGGDAVLMLETLGTMIDAFSIDPFAAKATMLERFAKPPRSPARVQSLVEGSRAVIDEAVAEDRYEIASGLAKTVSDACSRSSPQVRKETADRRKRVQQLQKQFEEVQKALETLKAKPEDADANLAAGTWYSFVKDDWKTGLPHLAKGSDALLKSLAQRELSSPPAGPEDQLKLADAWWDAAAERRGDQQAAMLRCAGHWYEQAIGQLQGINKTKAEKNLAQIAELAQDSAPRPGREPPPAIAPFDAKRARGYQLQWARYLKVPVEFTNSIGMKFVLIPPGEFDMGSTQQEVEMLIKRGKERNFPKLFMNPLPSEAPRHHVRLTQAFYLGQFEVTQAQYQQVMGSNPSRFKDIGPDAPVEQIAWDDAVAFCRQLSGLRVDKIGPGEYRLPTEAEWEYAARAGTTTAWCFGDNEGSLSDHAWWGSNSAGRTYPVGQKASNSFGLYDVHGNVWEWCADWHATYGQTPGTNPLGPPAGTSRVLRGGPYFDRFPDVFRCAFRLRIHPGNRWSTTGFRVARSLPAQTISPK